MNLRICFSCCANLKVLQNLLAVVHRIIKTHNTCNDSHKNRQIVIYTLLFLRLRSNCQASFVQVGSVPRWRQSSITVLKLPHSLHSRPKKWYGVSFFFSQSLQYTVLSSPLLCSSSDGIGCMDMLYLSASHVLLISNMLLRQLGQRYSPSFTARCIQEL